jgi:prephenate dehydratase
MKVAFQGERGAYSEIAARRLFGEKLKPIPCRTFDEIFAAVDRGRIPCGIVPLENSLAGSILQNYDLLLRHHLTIVGEVSQRITHNLIAHPGTTISSIRQVYSHPQALMQCAKYLSHLKRAEKIPAYDTAGAVKLIKERGLKDAAAIASQLAAEIYGMEVLQQGIENDPENYTRFVVLKKKTRPSRNAKKTSIVFSLRNMPGALFKSLSVFALRDIDLLKIESRPLHGKPWEYFFYVDLAGNIRKKNCQNALQHLSEIATYLKVLGSY